MTLLELVQENVRRAPQATALRCEGEELTYRGLMDLADAVACQLAEAGVCVDDTVAVLTARTPTLPATYLALWRLGATVLPLSTALPAERIEFMVKSAGARLVVVDEGTTSSVRGLSAHTLQVETVAAGQPPPVAPAAPHRPAYLLFTSGSTGRPKGVLVPHTALLNLLKSMERHLDSGPGHRWLASTAVTFDISLLELFLPLTSGGTLVLATDDDVMDVEQMLGLMDEADVTHVQATPSGWRVWLAAGMRGSQRTGLVGGEALSSDLANRLRGELAQVINVYGPTETAIWSTLWRLPAVDESVSIGEPLPNTRLYVLDARGLRLPRGAVGELHIAGAGVAHGYLGRPDLTGDRFVPDPWARRPGDRMYRTGDLVRREAGGALTYLGRADDQVKVRGHRIELGEIEETLRDHESVENAAVKATGSTQARRLIAYIRPARGHDLDEVALSAYVSRRLPAPMVPARFVALEQFPLNPAGKLDRRALPEPLEAFDPRSSVDAQTGLEHELVDIWREVLGGQGLGRHDRFFEVGADSLAAVEFLAAARRRGHDITLRTLYQHDTVADLAQALAGDVPSLGAIAEIMTEHGVPGASVALFREGEVVHTAAFGQVSPGGSAVSDDTVFQVGSISKHVTAFGVLALAGRGVVDIDRDITEYLRSWTLPGSAGCPPVTLRHLMAATSGLNATEGLLVPPEQPVPTLLDQLRDIRLEQEPGTTFVKHNSHSAVLQQVLQDVTGLEFADLMRETVLTPLGMVDSGFEPAYPTRAGVRVALGHDADGQPLVGGWRVRATSAAGGLWTTASDLAALACGIRAAHRGESSVLTSWAAEQMLTVAHDGSLFGLGTSLDPGAVDLEFGHVGDCPGYRALTLTRLGSGVGVVVLTNSDAGRQVHRAVADLSTDAWAELGAGLASAHAY